MRVSSSIVAAATALAACATVPAPPDPDGADAVVAAIAAAFSRCDVDGLVAHYAPAAEFVSPSTPEPLIGRAALREHFGSACAGTVRAVMTVERQRVQPLGAQAAVVTGSYAFGRSDRPADKPWPALFVITLAKTGPRWLVQTQATFAVPAAR